MTTQFNPVGWFEIPVIDLDRAKAFYEHVFDCSLELHQMDDVMMAWFPMYENAIGATGSLVKGEGLKPSSSGIDIYFSTPDIELALSRVREKGGTVITEKTSIGEYGFFGMAEDTEGNRIGLHSRT